MTTEDVREVIVDIQNEQVILGQALQFVEKRDLFLSTADYSQFLEPKHKVIAWCIFEMTRRSLDINDDSFTIVLDSYPNYNRSHGGNTYLQKLRSLSPSQNLNYEKHLQKLRDDHVKCDIARNRIVDLFAQVNNPRVTTKDLMASITILQDEIQKNRPIEIDFIFGDSLKSTYEEAYKSRLEGSGTFVTTGFSDLDEDMTEAFAKKNVSIISGFTGMAKSSWVHNAILRQAGSGLNCGLYSLEMISVAALDRMISIATGIPLMKIVKLTKELTEDERNFIQMVIDGLASSKKIFINDRALITIEDMDNELTLLKRKGIELDIVYIDLFGKLDDVSVADQLATNIEHKLRICRAIARKHNVHICNLVQIKRYFDMNTIKPGKPVPRPKLDKLKNSGAFAEEADFVLLLHRNKYYKPQLVNDILEVEIAKQRQGKMGVTKFFEFDAECTRILSTSMKPDDWVEGGFD